VGGGLIAVRIGGNKVPLLRPGDLCQRSTPLRRSIFVVGVVGWRELGKVDGPLDVGSDAVEHQLGQKGAEARLAEALADEGVRMGLRERPVDDEGEVAGPDGGTCLGQVSYPGRDVLACPVLEHTEDRPVQRLQLVRGVWGEEDGRDVLLL
jgi:hypothetical protein